MKEIVLELNLFELISLTVALVSIAINIYQFLIWRKDQRDRLRPMSNGLVALFNDIKAKQVDAYKRQQLLFSESNPHQAIETLKWDYAAFSESVIAYLRGLHEQVVALLVTLNPDDIEGQRVFHSQDYGLTPSERELRRRNDERLLADIDQQRMLAPVQTEKQAEADNT